MTVLFADLVGFTARAESMDPEDVRSVLAPYHSHLRSELERHGGTVEKFIGDAVMALFGAPVAHEDDPERAVRAALAIRDSIAEQGRLELRIAVTTGEALINLGARPSEGEGMASGDVVNTASRLQSAAPVNGILADETTHRATSQAIVYREHEPVAAKGKAEPVPVWEVVEARARFGGDVGQAPQTPLVDRAQELEVLTGALARVRAEREPQLVTIVGVPGIGKSRLVAELFASLEREPDLITWRQGRSLPYGDGVTYWALGEMVKSQAGILETDAPEEAARKLGDEIAGLLGEGAEARSVEASLRLLVGVEQAADQTEDKRAESFFAWRRFFEELAERRPAVLVFEDLHWADENLLDFVDYLVEWASEVPLLCVCTARPELLERRPAWGGGKPNASTISLSPLSDEDTASLIGALLERAVLPAEQQSALLAHAGGNPLYAEQFARMVAERTDAGELPLPETVQGIIAARLDALSTEEKLLLQDAAVLGKVFWAGALAEMNGRGREAVEAQLHALARKEFVRRERRPSVEGESEYSFRHLLVRDVAYGQIPRAARSEKHRAAADWIASLGRADDHSELLAHHYLQALEYGRATGAVAPALEEETPLALRRAGDRALALSAFAAAGRFYRAALDLWPADDPERPYVLFHLGVARWRGEHAGVEELEQARDALLELGDVETAAEAETIVALVERGAVELTRERMEHALELVKDRPPSGSKAFVLARLTFNAAMVADERWEAYTDEALAMAEALGREDLRVLVLSAAGPALVAAGEKEAGTQALGQAIEVLDAIGSPDSVFARINLGGVLQALGDLRGSFDVQAEGRRGAERFGLTLEMWHLRSELALEDYWCGRWDKSCLNADTFLESVEAGSIAHGISEIACLYARTQMRLARDDIAGAVADGEVAVTRGRDFPVWGALEWALASHARVLLAAGKRDEAEKLVGELLENWDSHGSGTIPYTVVDLAIALVDLDRGDELRAATEAAPEAFRWYAAANAFAAGDYIAGADVYAEIGSLPDEAYARLRSGREDQVEQALAFYRSVGATRYVREGEALLAASA